MKRRPTVRVPISAGAPKLAFAVQSNKLKEKATRETTSTDSIRTESETKNQKGLIISK
jgi:hypothetical protein